MDLQFRRDIAYVAPVELRTRRRPPHRDVFPPSRPDQCRRDAVAFVPQGLPRRFFRREPAHLVSAARNERRVQRRQRPHDEAGHVEARPELERPGRDLGDNRRVGA